MTERHPLDEMKDMLVEAIQERRQVLRDALLPEGSRPPFTTQLSKPEALDWWSRHRYDNFGQAVLQNMPAQAILELDLALSQKNERDNIFGNS